MKTAVAVFVAIAAGFLLFDRGIAIKCFVCNSFHQADCIDWFDNVTQHLVQCDDGYGQCRKVIQEVWLEDHWDIRYIRQCAANGVVGAHKGKVCQERYGSFNVRMRYCHCDNQDGCNSAPATMATSRIVPAILTLIAGVVPYVLVQR